MFPPFIGCLAFVILSPSFTLFSIAVFMYIDTSSMPVRCVIVVPVTGRYESCHCQSVIPSVVVITSGHCQKCYHCSQGLLSNFCHCNRGPCENVVVMTMQSLSHYCHLYSFINWIGSHPSISSPTPMFWQGIT